MLGEGQRASSASRTPPRTTSTAAADTAAPGRWRTLSAGARNLLRAGFRLVDVRTVWQPPEELIAPAEDEEGEEEWGGEDEDGDEYHDFVLGG